MQQQGIMQHKRGRPLKAGKVHRTTLWRRQKKTQYRGVVMNNKEFFTDLLIGIFIRVFGWLVLIIGLALQPWLINQITSVYAISGDIFADLIPNILGIIFIDATLLVIGLFIALRCPKYYLILEKLRKQKDNSNDPTKL